MMKTKLLGLFAAVGMLLATSCSQEQTDAYLSENGLVDFSFSVGLEGGVGTRAVTRADDATTKISDGTRATKLYFAIYDDNGKLFQFTPTFTTEEGKTVKGTAMKVGDNGALVEAEENETPLYYTASVEFPFTFSCQLVKGMDYKLVLWAQSENGDTYYNMSEFPEVTVNYKDKNGKFHANNDEMRDAFCVSYPIKASSVATSHNIVLTRPLSQINVGMTEQAWKNCLSTGVNGKIEETETGKLISSMIIEHAATKFDIRANNVMPSTDDTNDNLMKVEYQAAKIPFLLEELGTDKKIAEDDRYLYVDTDHDLNTDDEKFHWISMCYILANDESKKEGNDTYGTVIDNLTINICDGHFKTELENVPVKRNYRTNILITEDWWQTKKVTINLDRGYTNDFSGAEDNGKYNGGNNN